MKENTTGLGWFRFDLSAENLAEGIDGESFRNAFLAACRYARTEEEPRREDMPPATWFMYCVLQGMVNDSLNRHRVAVESGRKGGLSNAKQPLPTLSTAKETLANTEHQNTEHQNTEHKNTDTEHQNTEKPLPVDTSKLYIGYGEAELMEIATREHITLPPDKITAFKKWGDSYGWKMGSGEPIKSIAKVMRHFSEHPEKYTPRNRPMEQRNYNNEELEKIILNRKWD